MTDPCEAAKAIRRSPEFLSVPEEASIASQVLPGGFGGLYQDLTANSAMVLLKDLGKAAEVRPSLRSALFCDGVYPGWLDLFIDFSTVMFRPAQFTAEELFENLNDLASLSQDPDVWAIEVDVEANRIWIGLERAEAEARVAQAVQARSVPLAAVRLEIPPPTTGGEPFQVLNAPIVALASQFPGAFEAKLLVEFHNRGTATRYPEPCVFPLLPGWKFPRYTLEQWTGSAWREVYVPICDLVLHFPMPVLPLATVSDSIPHAAVRRLNALPVWDTPRITGTYRLVGFVYEREIPVAPLIEGLVPLEERVSAPFRIVSSLPF